MLTGRTSKQNCSLHFFTVLGLILITIIIIVIIMSGLIFQFNKSAREMLVCFVQMFSAAAAAAAWQVVQPASNGIGTRHKDRGSRTIELFLIRNTHMRPHRRQAAYARERPARAWVSILFQKLFDHTSLTYYSTTTTSTTRGREREGRREFFYLPFRL